MVSKIEKLAAKDAEELMAADMFYGEGAGTRRKLVYADVDGKMRTMPGYEGALRAAYDCLNQTEFAERAIKERKAIDRGIKAGRNLKALRTGNYHNLSTGLVVLVGAYYFAKQTGLDKEIVAKAKQAHADVKRKRDHHLRGVKDD